MANTEAGVSCAAVLAPFRVTAFRIVWASSLAAAGGQWMERVITAWLALGMGGDAVAVGAVLAVRLLPFILFGLVAGTVADRFWTSPFDVKKIVKPILESCYQEGKYWGMPYDASVVVLFYNKFVVTGVRRDA